MRTNLYSKTYVHPECIEAVEEHWQEDLGPGEELPELEEWHYDTQILTLKELLDMSKGMDPEKVIISIYRDRSVVEYIVASVDVVK